jgi:predicted metal-dependent hydrolase
MAEYEYEIIRSSRRTISAEIKRNKLIVRAPRRASNAEIERFLARNGSWIAKNMAKAQARE